jgi:hypothetical protein
MSFFSGFDLLGMTNRMMCMRRPAWGSPLSIMERILFCKGVRQPVQHGGATAIGISHHGLNLLLIAALLQSILQLRL